MNTPTPRYERAARRAQSDGRIPALSVALHRADREPWVFTVGESGNPAHPLGPDTRFRIGSVTKTFTAVLVLQARDEGLLDLDQPVNAYLDLPAHGDATLRRLLSHTAGFQREPHGDVWDTLIAPDAAKLVEELDRAERVLPNARRFHYSNLGLAVLGQLVAKVRGGTWEQIVAERILVPLGLDATTVEAPPQSAVGYLVDAYSDAARPEPPVPLGGVAPAAQLWSTAADMAKWAAFLTSPELVDPDGRVLKATTLDEMRWPLTTTDEALWGAGFGLGLILVPEGRRVMHVGHDGAMPGFLAGVYGRRGGEGNPGALGCAVLGSSGTAGQVNELVHELLRLAVELDPAEIRPWRIAAPAPKAYRSVLGHWWSEGSEFVFAWHDGQLQARLAEAPADRPPAVFAPLPGKESALPGQDDVLRTVSGRESGELLRLTRDEHGEVVRMHWATYRFRRFQDGFDGGPASSGPEPYRAGDPPAGRR
ncbi:CubicO group peptidase (beta-lactamase class C family) [Actinoplanes lutulentus]|uniref:CubicO group peptidase (Beta-lactamase class C family) n=1 Tax=Actinoplanes lutulentus TaxID=1287878 RepID=A0A327ZL60_9ACTN|nr:serine hydrolase domain-containing protein [Actinoplanes lutulentus]MBB2942015.1 CubicO group peptidase (beta-lactamase class C family) [Actinoplanes lutulentus]RAK39927.1 CubicO group peptidase (beta-lactamase class C family) [Actinoplanes lutulentus]